MNGELVGGVCNFQAEAGGGILVGAVADEAVRADGGTAYDQIDGVAPIPFPQYEFLNIIGDSESVFIVIAVVGKATGIVSFD